ncbi:acyltransferase family protein [Aestuariibaculum suncheonense]|uniref:acyltransferase family protein n=1 Tax=Aestuariibaculum suncheonense TaxID=1028745 RepID=UPI0031EB4C36
MLGLDAIRALAILLVLFSHSTLLLFPNENTLVLTAIRFLGTIGVDLFFVLSGYLIGGIILKQLEAGKTSLNDFIYFWIRRWFRTLPNYFLVLVLNILLFYFFSGEIINGLGNYFLFLQNFVTPQPDFFTESWSLSIEEYAYIIGPLLLYLIIRLIKPVNKRIWFLWVSVLLIITSAIMRYNFHINHSILSDGAWSGGLRKVVIYRLDSIYFGFVFIYLMNKYRSAFERYTKTMFVLGFGVFLSTHILIALLGLTPVNTPLFFNVFYLPILSVCLLLLFPSLITIDTFNYVKLLITKLSIISYALYLLNYSVILLTIQHFTDVCEASLTVKIITLLTYWSLSIYLSHLLYTYFEKPMMNLRDKPFFKRILS